MIVITVTQPNENRSFNYFADNESQLETKIEMIEQAFNMDHTTIEVNR